MTCEGFYMKNQQIEWILNKRLISSLIILVVVLLIIFVSLGEVMLKSVYPVNQSFQTHLRIMFLSLLPVVAIVVSFMMLFPKAIGFSHRRIYFSFMFSSKNFSFEIQEIDRITFLKDFEKISSFKILTKDDRVRNFRYISDEIITKIRLLCKENGISIKESSY